jgi:Mrp family chromosome partitioning ATPase/uncharacterized protein involved in exopolysaccharide biosynthesis
MIGIITIIAIIAAIVVFEWQSVNYMSEAKLLIRYVVDTKPLTENGEDAQVTPMNLVDSGESIMGAEVEMIHSMDVCEQVAKIVGPGKIISKGEGTNDVAAGFLIQKQLLLEREKGSDVIRIVFTHRDRDVVVPVLTEIINAYKAKHDEVRRPKTGESLMSTIDTYKTKVEELENKLLAERKKVDISSLDESMKATAADIERLQSELEEVDTERAVASTIVGGMKKELPADASARAASTAAALTNQAPEVSPAIINEYKSATTILASLRSEESDLLSWTTTNNNQVKAVESRIANTEKKCRELEEQHPGLVAIKAASSPSGSTSMDPMVAYGQAMLKAQMLEVRYQMLTNQLATAKIRQGRILSAEGPLRDLQRECDRYRTTLDNYQKRQSEADLAGLLDPGNTQIRPIEDPTPPRGDFVKVGKMCAGVFFGGLFLALGLPFVIEMYFDQSLKRPLDIQNRLGVPFFISMPKLKKTLNGKPQRAALNGEKKVPLLAASNGEVLAADPTLPPPAPSVSLPDTNGNGNGNGNGHIAPWEQRHALRPFFETLRDRLMTYFEVINLTHKPKLVAITSCGEGAGVTTTAAGLASALSETGDGNVLLVNMNVQDGEAHHFYRGRLTCGLEEALERDKRNAACVQDNLFIAKDMDINENLPRVLPKRFSHLVPKMRASDYDYIIFDMPPMSQISITPRLARFMDMVLLVVESEKTDRDVAKRATNLLLESKTNVGVVLNKSRDHLPRRLQQDI